MEVSTPASDLSTLQMHDADDVGEHLVIVIEVRSGADESHIAADPGKILPEFRQQARRGILVVVQRVM